MSARSVATRSRPTRSPDSGVSSATASSIARPPCCSSRATRASPTSWSGVMPRSGRGSGRGVSMTAGAGAGSVGVLRKNRRAPATRASPAPWSAAPPTAVAPTRMAASPKPWDSPCSRRSSWTPVTWFSASTAPCAPPCTRIRCIAVLPAPPTAKVAKFRGSVRGSMDASVPPMKPPAAPPHVRRSVASLRSASCAASLTLLNISSEVRSCRSGNWMRSALILSSYCLARSPIHGTSPSPATLRATSRYSPLWY